MEFRDVITAGILHEISEKAKKRLKTAGKIGAGAAALGGAAYLAHQKMKGEGGGGSTPDKVGGTPSEGVHKNVQVQREVNRPDKVGGTPSEGVKKTADTSAREASKKAAARDTLHTSKSKGETQWERAKRAESRSRAGAKEGGRLGRMETKLRQGLSGFGPQTK